MLEAEIARGDALIGGDVCCRSAQNEFAELHHIGAVGDLQRGLRVLFDQQHRYAAFAQLAAVRREQRRAAEFLLSSAMSTTLEDVVHELVRPMLGGWLNAKLPEMIDRVVQDEIARMNADAAD